MARLFPCSCSSDGQRPCGGRRDRSRSWSASLVSFSSCAVAEVLLGRGGVTLGGERPHLLGEPVAFLLESVRDARHLLVLTVDRIEATHRLELLHLELASLLLGGLERLLDRRQLLGQRGAAELLLVERSPQPRQLGLHLGQRPREVAPVGLARGELLLERGGLGLGPVRPACAPAPARPAAAPGGRAGSGAARAGAAPRPAGP